MKVINFYQSSRQISLRLSLFVVAVFIVNLFAQAQDYSSPSDNLPPKKETLEEKIKRYESAGYKIAVYQQVHVLSQQKQTATTAISEFQVPVTGTGELCEACLDNKSSEIAQKLNSKYKTAIFEVVDISALPTKTVFGQAIPDWWSTQYKSVVHFQVTTTADAFIDSKDQKVRYEIIATFYPMLMEYINEKNGKQKIIAFAITNLLSWKMKTEDSHTPESATGLKLTVNKLMQHPEWLSSEDLNNSFNSGYEDILGKFFEKLDKN